MTIKIEQLSKKYLIHNKRKVLDDTLKDRLTQGVKGFFNRFRAGSLKTSGKKEFWALKDLSFEVKQGDSLAIIGKNGAGKSTLLKIFSRITPPTKGRVKISGRVASLLEVGTGFHPELTGRENIYLNGALLGMSKREIKKNFDEIVDFSEIEMFLDTPVKRYSSGMFVRLGFAVAAHLNPDILIIDEALAVGDAAYKKKCIAKMEDIGKEGRTVIFVTHDMWALNFCNKGILLHEGEIVPTDNLEHCVALYSGSNREMPSVDKV